jgi:hypothetical protein
MAMPAGNGAWSFHRIFSWAGASGTQKRLTAKTAAKTRATISFLFIFPSSLLISFCNILDKKDGQKPFSQDSFRCPMGSDF